LRAWRADLEILDIRGNVETRIKKLDDGIYEAIVLAEAGLHRLGYLDRVAQKLPLHRLLPAVGQGALGLETRADDETTIEALAALNHLPSQLAVTAERSLLAHLRGGCLAPVAAWCRMEDDKLRLEAKVLSLDGQTQLQADRRFAPDQAQEEGRLAAEELIAAGAQQLIESARTKPPTPST
jgi:hydroxymethylbilane synthase